MDKDKQERCRIKINLTSGELEAEGPKQFVEKILSEYGSKLKAVPITPQVKPVLTLQAGVTGKQPSQQFSKATNIRDFYLEKKPGNDKEAAAVVAFYLSEIAEPREKQTQINKETLKKYLKLAGHRLPTNTAQTLLNAKFVGYLDSGESAGEYKLSAIGYNLVAHQLPGEQSKSVEQKPRKKRRPKKAKSGKQKK